MRRLVFLLLSVTFLFSVFVPSTRALAPVVFTGTPPATGFRTVSRLEGYQVQVPSDWLQKPDVDPTERASSPGTSFASPDSKETLFIVSSQSASAAGDLSAAATKAVHDLDGRSKTGTVNVFQGPVPVQVAGADAAVEVLGALTETNGNQSVIAIRLASRAQTIYFFNLAVPQDYYSSDPNVRTILNSFQLTAPSTGAPAPPFALSPEEAVIAILPYQLSAAEAPSGYTIDHALSIETPVTIVLGSDSFDVFAAYERTGLILRYTQFLTPTAQATAADPNATTGSLKVHLFADAASAAADATGKSRPLDQHPFGPTSPDFEPITLAIAPGDASAGWRSTPGAGFQSSESYIIRWQRGQLSFELDTGSEPLGAKKQSDVESLVAALDASEQKRPPLTLGAATVTPPATELQRLQAAIMLKAFVAGLPRVADGYNLGALNVTHPLEEVTAAADPLAALRQVDEQWKVIISANNTSSQNLGGGSPRLTAQVTLCADPQAAAVDAADESVDPGWTSTKVDPPVQLGDTTLAFRDSGPGRGGTAQESIALDWLHGALLLRVQMGGPAGSTSMDQVVALAQQLEARFQANPLATRGLPDLTPAGASSSTSP